MHSKKIILKKQTSIKKSKSQFIYTQKCIQKGILKKQTSIKRKRKRKIAEAYKAFLKSLFDVSSF